jgi:alkanesulfonate monooxygenase SsuD/methylene tetrahydromethanopterin reductase-like flavin-dependent oxidoreductase (luciferase family)
MPGVFPVIGRTQEEAQEKFDALQNLIHPTVGLSLLSNMAGGVDLSAFPVDGPFPNCPKPMAAKAGNVCCLIWRAARI